MSVFLKIYDEKFFFIKINNYICNMIKEALKYIVKVIIAIVLVMSSLMIIGNFI